MADMAGCREWVVMMVRVVYRLETNEIKCNFGRQAFGQYQRQMGYKPSKIAIWQQIPICSVIGQSVHEHFISN